MKFAASLLASAGVAFLMGVTLAPAAQVEYVTRPEFVALEDRVARLEYLHDAVATNTPVITDWDIPTLVATFTGTGTPIPASATSTQGSTTPTREVMTTPFSATPTFFNATNTHTPTRTPVIAAPTQTLTPAVSELPPMVYAENVSGSRLRIRECAGLTCEQLGWVLVNETVVIDPQQLAVANGYRWVRLWNDSGWVAYEQISPAVRFLRW